MEQIAIEPEAKESSFPMPVTVDSEGANWEAPSWRPLATVGGALGAGASALVGGLLAGKRRRGAIAAAGAGVLVAGSAFSVASLVVREFLGAPHNHPLTDDERAFLEENPEAEFSERLRRYRRIGRMICGAKPDSWEGYYKALEPQEEERLRENRRLEEEATWAWSQGVDISDVRTSAEDDIELAAHGMEPHPGSRRWVMLVHGYHGSWNEMSQYAHHWAEKGYNMLFPEMRGHGDSGGDVIGMGWLDRRDLMRWLWWLVEARGEDIDIVLHGHSMGGASVLLAAAEDDLPEQVSSVVSDCAYSDALNVLSPILREGFRIPVHPAMELLRLAVLARPGGYDLGKASPEEAASRIRVPVLLFHGERDTFVPPYMVRRIYAAFPEGQARMATFPGAGHCQSMCSDPDRYWNEVFSFVEC